MIDRLGILGEVEQTQFSSPIDLDAGIDDGFSHSKGLVIMPLGDNKVDFKLHPHISQFQPVVDVISTFEANRVQDERITQVALMIRQSKLSAGSVQHSSGHVMHRDDHNPLTKKRIYAVSDHYATEFYEHLEHPVKNLSKRVSNHPVPSYVPHPYEIVGSSAGVLHCSPIVPEEITRTFLRLTFCYQQ